MRARLGCGLLALLALIFPAQAAGGSGSPPLGRLLPEIRRHAPGSLYDVDGPYRGPDGLARYRIKWMTPEGRIIWFEVDARSGHILGMVTGTMPGKRRSEGVEEYPPYPPEEYGPQPRERWRDDGGAQPSRNNWRRGERDGSPSDDNWRQDERGSPPPRGDRGKDHGKDRGGHPQGPRRGG
jgi:hypothetical protein